MANEGGGSDASGSAAAMIIMAASGAAGLKEYLVSIHCGRDDADDGDPRRHLGRDQDALPRVAEQWRRRRQ